MNTMVLERRLISRRLDDRCRPDGGAVLVTICIFSIVSGAIGFFAGAWFGWCMQ